MPVDEVFIGVGGNIGDSMRIVEQAIALLDKVHQCRLSASSSLYRSSAIGDIEQADYINAVAKIECSLTPLELLLELQAIEHAYYRHRDPEQRWAPRTLDLDIILFGDLDISDSHLTIPHPEFVKRRFVLEPMFEIEGDRLIPGLGHLGELIERAPILDLEKITGDA